MDWWSLNARISTNSAPCSSPRAATLYFQISPDELDAFKDDQTRGARSLEWCREASSLVPAILAQSQLLEWTPTVRQGPRATRCSFSDIESAVLKNDPGVPHRPAELGRTTIVLDLGVQVKHGQLVVGRIL
jgi:hypothetical protein